MSTEDMKDTTQIVNMLKDMTPEEKARAEGFMIGMKTQKEAAVTVAAGK